MKNKISIELRGAPNSYAKYVILYSKHEMSFTGWTYPIAKQFLV